MAYIKPEEVLSPRRLVGGVIEVIHDPGVRHMSVARIIWDGEERIATRWNGDDERPLGNPVSRGQATWFVVDDYAAASIEHAARAAAQDSPHGLAAGYREMAADRDREHDADDWVEGLMGDGIDQTR